MAKWTEKKDDAADRRAGIKQGSARDTRLDRARGLPPDVVKKGKKVGAGHAANKLNPLGAGNAKKGSSGHVHGVGCGCDAGRGVGLRVGAGADLSMAQRKKLPSKSFALPGRGSGPSGKGSGSYPIPDASHARNALARASGKPVEATVRAKVKARFPNIGKGS